MKKKSLCKLSKWPIGRILVDGEFITPKELETALNEQKRTNELLGEILVRLSLISPADLRVALSIQRDIATCEGAYRAVFGIRQMLGEILLRAKRIKEEDLESALEEQKKTGEKLGEILIKRGLISKEELDVALTLQRHLERELPDIEKLHLGELLVEAGYISREHLCRAEEKQKALNKPLEEILIEEKYIEPHQVEHGKRLQRMLVTAAIAAALTLAPVTYAEPADATPSKAVVTVTATVVARTNLNVLHQAPEIVITEADVERGYVDVRSATKIEIKSNSGYSLIFENNGFPFKEVEVSGLGRTITIGQNGGMVFHPEKGSAIIELNYRFLLYKDIHPGTYNWPLSISVSPM